MKSDKPLVFLGCGDLGGSAAQRLQRGGYPVIGVRRFIDALPDGVPGLALDYTNERELQLLSSLEPRAVVITFTPVAADALGYRRGYLEPLQQLVKLWANRPPIDVLYVSSTSVYGDQGGGWVDESTSVCPQGETAKVLVEAEQCLLGSQHRTSLLRMSGIYGRPPARLLQRVSRGELCPRQPVRYSNRIHRDDCVGLICHLLEKLLAGEPLQASYIGVDDDPAPQWEVESWLSQQLEVENPRCAEAAGRQGANKRCRNLALQQSGYLLLHASYRSGYRDLLQNWKNSRIRSRV